MMLYFRKGPSQLRQKRKFGKILLALTVAAAFLTLLPLRNIEIFPEIKMNISPEKPEEILLVFNPSDSQVYKNIKDEGLQHQCGMPKSCPKGTFAFSVKSGAANVIPPQMCFNGQVILSKELRNTNSGLNIAVINARTGEVIKTDTFNMWLGEVDSLVPFLKTIESNTLVLIATYDDGATKITDEARRLIAELGSTAINKLAFRDNWVFAGGKGISGKSPFEQHIENNQSRNKYDTWPELLEMKDCFPQKLD